MNLSPVNYQINVANNGINNRDKTSFKALQNVYAKGFRNNNDVEKILEWFKNNKYVKTFLENNDVDLYIKSKRNGKKIIFNMDIKKYVQTLVDKPYRVMTYKPFNIKSLTKSETVTKLPRERHFGIKYSVKGASAEESLEKLQKYLNENTCDVYKPNPCPSLKAPSEVLAYEVPHIAQDLYKTECNINGYLSQCNTIKNKTYLL